MGKNRRSSVQRYHDRVAGRYDDSYNDAYWKWHDALTWDYLKPFLPSDLRTQIVDLGCGTGKWTAKIAKSGYQVTGIDISAKMLNQTLRKLADAGVNDRADTLQADLCDLSKIPGQTFGMAVALGDPIGCTEDPRKALREIRRILTQDGMLVATFDNRLAAIDFYLSRNDTSGVERFLRDGKTHWLTRETSEQFPIQTYGPTELRRVLENAGFEILDLVGKTVLPMRHHRHLLATPSDRRRWARIEKSLCRDPAAIGRAGHLQVACRVIRGYNR